MRTRTPLAAPELKFTPLSFKAVAADGAFEGYASLFDKEDLGHDVIAPGAFRDSLARRGPTGIKMLFQHNPSEPIGVWDIVREDVRGLWVRGRLMREVARAREVLALMRAGALDGLSIGFRAVKGRRDPRTGVRRLAKVDLWEISVVTFPLLPEARVAQVKSHDRARLAASIAAATHLLRRSTRPPRRSSMWRGREAGPLGSLRFPTRKYSPDQPRLPAGQSGGGQWRNDGSNVGGEAQGAPIGNKPIRLAQVGGAAEMTDTRSDTSPTVLGAYLQAPAGQTVWSFIVSPFTNNVYGSNMGPVDVTGWTAYYGPPGSTLGGQTFPDGVLWFVNPSRSRSHLQRVLPGM